MMIEVDKATFYAAIGTQNVQAQFLPGPYPYTSEFVTPTREVRGRRVGYIPEGEALAKHRYFLPNTGLSGGTQSAEADGSTED